MRKYLIAAVAATTLGGVVTAEAGKCRGTQCGPAVPNICETISLDPAVWAEVKSYHHRRGSKNVWWQTRSLVCGGNCVTYKKNYTSSTYACAPMGAEICFKDPWGRKHVWKIDGIEEPAR